MKQKKRPIPNASPLSIALAAAFFSTSPAIAQIQCPAASFAHSIAHEEPASGASMGTASLAQMAASHGKGSGLGTGESVGGLYIPQVKIKARAANSERKINGEYHVCIASLELDISNRPTIHIAREIETDECGRQAVYAHEYTHHLIQKEQTRSAVDAYVAANRPPTISFHSNDRNQAQALASAWIDAFVQQAGNTISNFVNPKQEAFDSRAEYERISRLCPAAARTLWRASGGR